MDKIPTVDSCDKGYKGSCCCMCVSQLTVTKHPWNKSELAKGKISEIMGYVCTGDGSFNIFFDNKHGCCELYLKKENT